VLAGGKAQRFQISPQAWQDKSLALLANKPLLSHVIENVTPIVDEVIVCVNNAERMTKYSKILEKYKLNVKIVIDEKANVMGPNVAILTGLKATQTDLCMIIPCDMPFIKPKIVDYLFNISEDFDVVMPMWPNGELETLIMVLKRSIGQEIVQTLCQLNRSRPGDIPRAASKTLLVSPLKNIKTLDPHFKSFININTQEDLKKLQTRKLQGPLQKNIHLIHGNFLISNLQLMRSAAKKYQENKFSIAQEKFDLCKNHFEKCNNHFWTALSSEGKGAAILKQIQQNENSTQTPTEIEYKEALSNAINSYHNEAKTYEENQCTRLLERTIADKHRIIHF
jgi:molybdopterin-guanine dinucleotide biosynthesis protein A